jgi:hypothetical protein
MISNTPFIGVLQCRKVIANLELIRFSCKTSNKKGSRLAASLHNKVSVERKSVFVAARGASAAEAAATSRRRSRRLHRRAKPPPNPRTAIRRRSRRTRAAATAAAFANPPPPATCDRRRSHHGRLHRVRRRIHLPPPPKPPPAPPPKPPRLPPPNPPPAAAAEAAFTARTTLRRIALDRFAHADVATVHDGAFHGFESLAAVGIVLERDETEAAAAARLAIRVTTVASVTVPKASNACFRVSAVVAQARPPTNSFILSFHETLLY